MKYKPKFSHSVASIISLVATLAMQPASASGLSCQYQGRPTSVQRSSTGFGLIFGQFQLVNPSGSCPGNINTIQFSGSSGTNSTTFESTIESCLNIATLLVVHSGLITVDLSDPIAGDIGVVIANAQSSPVVNACTLNKRT